MIRLSCTGILMFKGGYMKFLKINAKVLLILCLFSGILFLSTGCGENTDNEKENNGSEVNGNETTNGGENNNTSDQDDEKEGLASNSNTNTTTNENVDYSVWVANTTINTDKTQKSYKVIWGDTLWLISTAWDVSYQEIATFNNIPNPDLIYVDQVIYNPLFK